MWSVQVSDIAGRAALHFAVQRSSGLASYGDVLAAWSTDAAFCTWFNGVVAGVAFSAFRWETPPITTRTIDRPFEFVVLDGPKLERPASSSAFSEHLRTTTDDEVVVFPNLGHDAILVVPRATADHSVYAHLGAFVRGAPAEQRLALWQAVGAAATRRLSAKPVWLSTAGAGVPWLHVRLDDRPKYYGHVPFRVAK